MRGELRVKVVSSENLNQRRKGTKKKTGPRAKPGMTNVWNGGKRRNPPAPKNEVRRQADGLQESKMDLVPPSSGRGYFIADSLHCFANHSGREPIFFILSYCACTRGCGSVKF